MNTFGKAASDSKQRMYRLANGEDISADEIIKIECKSDKGLEIQHFKTNSLFAYGVLYTTVLKQNIS